MKSLVFVTQRIPEAGLKVLRRELGGFEINPEAKPLPKAALRKKVRGRNGILCLLTDIIDEEVFITAGPSLRAVSNCAVGFDNIDVAAAARRGVIVTNTPGVLTEATAEMAWGLLLACARRIAESDRFTRAGRFRGWDPELFLGQKVFGKTLGIVGAGRIGTCMAGMSRGFLMKVLYCGRHRHPALEKDLGAVRVSLPRLLRESDFVSLHVSLNEKTRHLIGKKELALMKSSAVLVNTSRGALMDEKALVQALQKKKIFAAGLDVYECEPALARGLKDCPNAVLTPHLASATGETRSQMAALAAKNLADVLKGRSCPNIVNPPGPAR